MEKSFSWHLARFGERGLTHVSQRIRWRVWKTVGYVAAPLIALTVVSLRPFVTVRILWIDAARIGHLLVFPEIVYATRRLERPSETKRILDVWGVDGPVCNKYALKVLNRRKSIIRLPGIRTAQNLLRRSGRHEHLVITDPLIGNQDFYGAMARTPRSLWLTQPEVQSCRRLLAASVPTFSGPWVCIANRDAAYLDREYEGGNSQGHSYRNSRVQNYVLAVKALIALGYFVIRMGRVVAEELPLTHPRFFDYAVSKCRSDLLDFYLGFGCTFFVSTGSGVEDFAGVARRPRCYVNYVPFGAFKIQEPKSIHITKSHRDAVTNRVLTQSELIERGAHNFYYLNQYEESEIVIQENSPDEIRDVALEMHDLLTGNYQQTAEDRARQDQFWTKYPLEGLRAPGVPVRTLIGRQFLQDNPQWLQ